MWGRQLFGPCLCGMDTLATLMSPGEGESEKTTCIHHLQAFQADKRKTLVCLLKNGLNWQTPHGPPVADGRLPVTDHGGFSLAICAMIDEWDTAEAFSSPTAVSQTSAVPKH